MPIPLAASCSLSVIYLLCVMGFLLFYLFIYFSVAILCLVCVHLSCRCVLESIGPVLLCDSVLCS